MKTSIVAFVVLSSSLFLGSCAKKGVSEEMKTKMNTFEADWKKTMDDMTAWGQTMNNTMMETNKMMTEMPMEDMGKMDAKMKMQMDSINMQCKNQMGMMDNIKTTYTTGMTNMANDQKAYMDWKAKVQKGEVKEPEAMKGMDDWNAKLAAYKADMMNWNTMMNDTKMKCDQLYNDMKNMDMKDMKGKKGM